MKQLYNVEVPERGLRFSTGSLAKQANGAVTVQLGDTCVFVSAVAAESPRSGQDFFPLSVDYREKFSAAGRIPGGYFKREGRPSEKEVLSSRLCDRPLRPLFPKGFMNEVQIIGYLLSADLQNDGDILMINGASAALLCSDIPWGGPIGAIRLADIGGEWVVNPTHEQMLDSRLDMVYVGNGRHLLMIEGNADQLPEERFLEALRFAQESIQPILRAQRELATLAGKPKRDFPLVQPDERVLSLCSHFEERLREAIALPEKISRNAAIAAVKEEIKASIDEKLGEDLEEPETALSVAFEELLERTHRHRLLEEGKRSDARACDEIRPIECATGILPCVHGSALFQRGETQALVTTTLGSSRDVQEIDAVSGGIHSKTFVLHYNFPPFSVGETGRMGSTGRREIGHGALAERSLTPVLPGEEEFPYAIRVLSDILESNGSSSMATVCGGCLALMDAGVKITAPVAGISLGLVSATDENGEIQKHLILTDIIDAEDHFGDMDFKIAGTQKGITGFQLDLKIHGLPLSVAEEAVIRSRAARLKILELMRAVQADPREELRENAPRYERVKIDPEKIGALIGPGGKNIKRITEISGAQIDIHEDNSGWVSIFATGRESLERALQEIQLISAEIEPGKVYRGIVRSVKDFGIFVECIPGKEGMVHVSELSDIRIERPEDVCRIGDEIVVKCVGIDERGRVRLSRKAALCEARGDPYEAKMPSSRPRGAPRERTSSHRER
ncbi:MAG: polyribonucleotide nucleotidyltransferase [Puniceicoccales bacterium]|jgi:polyribonucleotide nucleotidyltransferase|nr:polyribonucleotide nucleotidyltransferase [Puniceicoccales bacterium]